MKILSRDFTTQEKVILLILCIFLVGLAYYQFVDKPVRTSLARAESEKAALEVELQAVQAKNAQLKKMQDEINQVTSGDAVSVMPSYNNSKAVITLLDEVLGSMKYSINFSNVTRSGDQIRRNISVSFTAPNYSTMETVLERLTHSEFRCLIDNVSCSRGNARYTNDLVSVNLTATFYETMVGGTSDSGLPSDSAAAR